jgi:hypothetical protein
MLIAVGFAYVLRGRGGDVISRAAGSGVRAERWRFSPRMGRSRAFSRPWCASIGLFAYCPTVCGD